MARTFFCITTLFLSLHTYAQRQNYTTVSETDTGIALLKKAAQLAPSPRQLRWQQLELTAFFHFGVNTFTNREWGDGKENPRLFNPRKLDTRQWVQTVKAAGIRQVIITAKHHDGFCLWPSRYTEHSVKNSAWKNGKGDLVKELATACREQGMGFGVYLSPWDRNSPLYGTPAYNDYFANQLTELLTQYGRIDEVWFDGANGEGPNGKKQVYDFGRWYVLIRQLQPGATIAIMGPDVRWVGTESGYGRETEWSVVPVEQLNPDAVAANSQQAVAFKPAGDMMGDDLGSRDKIRKARALVWYPAETDVSIRPGWFYHPAEDSLVKTEGQLTDIYFHSVGRNSVLLLNIPPDTNGLVSGYDQRSLQEWKKNLNKIFRVNLLKGAGADSRSRSALNRLTDGNMQTALQLTEDNPWELKLKAPLTFNVLSLSEDIRLGQHIESFILEGWIENAWQKITGGTTIGYKRLLEFQPVTTNKIRLRILSARAAPFVSEMGLYVRDK
ncbi:MAG: alpha-L-fucosidase [Ferruginibacter sp.]